MTMHYLTDLTMALLELRFPVAQPGLHIRRGETFRHTLVGGTLVAVITPWELGQLSMGADVEIDGCVLTRGVPPSYHGGPLEDGR